MAPRHSEQGWAHDSAPGTVTSPSRRSRMGSKSGGMGHSKDPVLQLMMARLDAGHTAADPVKLSLDPPYVTSPSGFPVQPSAAPARPRSPWQRLKQQPLWMKVLLFALLLVALVLAIALPVGLRRANARRRMQPPQHDLGPRLNTSGMVLLFGEDFTSFDSATWGMDLGDGSDYGLDSWGNNELQCYTNSPNNLDVIPHPDYPEDDGVLRIRPVYSAQQQPCYSRASQQPTSNRQWTSAKIHTKNTWAFTWFGKQAYTGPYASYAASGTAAAAAAAAAGGSSTSSTSSVRRSLQAAAGATLEASAATNSGSNTAAAAAAVDSNRGSGGSCGSVVVESRIKLPVAAGRWSALWMMPMPQPCTKPGSVECGAYGPWPASGEIDIVEQVNTDQEVLGTVHFADRLGFHQYMGASRALTPAQLLDWNIYQIVWNCSSISWYVNTQPVFQVTKQDLEARGAAVWPFSEPFFLILNTAIGGWLTGGVAPDKGQSQPFLVDYVRVWGSGS